jgi:hypothetical protein
MVTNRFIEILQYSAKESAGVKASTNLLGLEVRVDRKEEAWRRAIHGNGYLG